MEHGMDILSCIASISRRKAEKTKENPLIKYKRKYQRSYFLYCSFTDLKLVIIMAL